MEQAIRIPTKTYLKKFLLTTFDQREPFIINERSGLGKNLMSSMLNKLEYVNVKARYTDTLQVAFNKSFPKSSVQRLIYINSLLEEMFKEALIVWVFSGTFNGVSVTQALKGFLSFYGISESEYTYAAAHKLWQRVIRRKKEGDNYLPFGG